jgi:hypothetical protein
LVNFLEALGWSSLSKGREAGKGGKRSERTVALTLSERATGGL